jgi:predicted Fe-Mo cluster-binding NifX family protein
MMIAIANWQDSVSPVFDVSDRLCLIETENGKELRRENILLKSRDPFGRAKEMASLGVELLICGAISHVLETTLMSAGIRVAGFICGKLETVLGAFLRGQLTGSRFLMPGCFGKRQRHHFQYRHGRN